MVLHVWVTGTSITFLVVLVALSPLSPGELHRGGVWCGRRGVRSTPTGHAGGEGGFTAAACGAPRLGWEGPGTHRGYPGHSGGTGNMPGDPVALTKLCQGSTGAPGTPERGDSGASLSSPGLRQEGLGGRAPRAHRELPRSRAGAGG